METDLDAIVKKFESLTDWDGRYRYLIELGRALPELDTELKTKENQVSACVSKVWLMSNCESNRMKYQADSDAVLVRGLLVMLLAAMDGKTPADVLAMDVEAVFERIGLQSHLTPQRANGVVALIREMKQAAYRHNSQEKT